MTADLGDLAQVFQTQVLPTAPGIGRFVNAIADRDINADGGFACTGVDDVGIGRRYFQRAHGRRCEITVADIFPILPGVAGLPDAAADAAEVKGIGFARVPGDRDHASAPEGSDAAEFREPGEF